MATLQDMKNMSIQDVEADSLVEITGVTVDMDMPQPQRMKEVVRQMNGNPYFFRYNKLLVKVGYADTPVTFEQRMEDYLRTL